MRRALHRHSGSHRQVRARNPFLQYCLRQDGFRVRSPCSRPGMTRRKPFSAQCFGASRLAMTLPAFPGCCATRSVALLIRGPSSLHGEDIGPGSAEQRYTLRRVRETSLLRCHSVGGLRFANPPYSLRRVMSCCAASGTRDALPRPQNRASELEISPFRAKLLFSLVCRGLDEKLACIVLDASA